MSTYACVMAGGSGERFWPLSRTAKPKHLLKLFSDQTLLELTMHRLSGVVATEQMLVLTNALQLEAVKKCVPFPEAHVLAEPAKRDTAPAAALATAWALRHDPDAMLILLPSDAWIKDTQSFRQQVQQLVNCVERTGAMGTLAVTPTHAATGYGYLRLGEQLAAGCHRVERFVEKPNAELAHEYVQSGKYGWNAGIFVWSGKTFLKECERQQAQLADWIKMMVHAEDWQKSLDTTFAQLPKISVDYAIMEKAENVVALPTVFDWDDVGSWTALPEHLGEDESANTLKGSVSVHQARGNIVFSEKRHVALCGVENLVVVETEDAVLVCHRDAVQEIKHLQKHLPENLK